MSRQLCFKKISKWELNRHGVFSSFVTGTSKNMLLTLTSPPCLVRYPSFVPSWKKKGTGWSPELSQHETQMLTVLWGCNALKHSHTHTDVAFVKLCIKQSRWISFFPESVCIMLICFMKFQEGRLFYLFYFIT